MPLELSDLKPVESSFVLSDHPGKKFTLRKFALDAQIWLQRAYQEDQIKEIFRDQKIKELSRIAYFLLKDKSEFPKLALFRQAIVTYQDRVALIAALIQTVGVSQPVIKKLNDEEVAKRGNAQSSIP